MSTLVKLWKHETDKPPKLVRFVPRLIGGEKQRRMLTMTPDIDEWLKAPVRSAALIDIKARARAHFGQFVKGERIDDCRFMKRIEDRRSAPPSFAHEVWAISPRFGDPQYRFFGTFVTQDWFLVTSKQDRTRLEEHENRWHAEIDKVCRIWTALFGDALPLSGTQLLNYISMNAEHCDDRW